jgi:hypothetical protein
VFSRYLVKVCSAEIEHFDQQPKLTTLRDRWKRRHNSLNGSKSIVHRRLIVSM